MREKVNLVARYRGDPSGAWLALRWMQEVDRIRRLFRDLHDVAEFFLRSLVRAGLCSIDDLAEF